MGSSIFVLSTVDFVESATGNIVTDKCIFQHVTQENSPVSNEIEHD
jgi:hypothetical protein